MWEETPTVRYAGKKCWRRGGAVTLVEGFGPWRRLKAAMTAVGVDYEDNNNDDDEECVGSPLLLILSSSSHSHSLLKVFIFFRRSIEGRYPAPQTGSNGGNIIGLLCL